ncbi:hypothetical protein BAE44_0018363 [Dichanthelium oligosanthes]|uniref:NAD(P)-binding domain-containing protein n=1 Tax=Dichanthelium oligosanthes TaxID=888268 RepID=A0A1E5V631_9POAL|nr:hypothetical protein BAE44_0018363 [Dichanthelium oligosanthes]
MEAAGDSAGARRGGLVCVTGGSGFIGSWLVRLLLDRGYTVHATVKNLQDEGETKHLQALDGAGTRLRLFQMNLLDDASSMRPAIEGARGVFHLASPLTLHTRDPEAISLSMIILGCRVAAATGIWRVYFIVILLLTEGAAGACT